MATYRQIFWQHQDGYLSCVFDLVDQTVDSLLSKHGPIVARVVVRPKS